MTDHIIDTEETTDIEVVDLGVASEETQGGEVGGGEIATSRPVE